MKICICVEWGVALVALTVHMLDDFSCIFLISSFNTLFTGFLLRVKHSIWFRLEKHDIGRKITCDFPRVFIFFHI